MQEYAWFILMVSNLAFLGRFKFLNSSRGHLSYDRLMNVAHMMSVPRWKFIELVESECLVFLRGRVDDRQCCNCNMKKIVSNKEVEFKDMSLKMLTY